MVLVKRNGLIRVSVLMVLGFILYGADAHAERYVFTTTFFPQFAEIDEKGHKYGLAIELIHELFEDIGEEVVVEIYPRQRALQEVLNGRAHGLIGPGKTKEREQVFRFSQLPFYSTTQVFYVRMDDSFEWRGDYTSLAAKTIVMQIGWGVPKKLETKLNSLTVKRVATTKQGFLMLAYGRVDLLLTSRHDAAAFFADTEHLMLKEKMRELHPVAASTPGFFAYDKKRNDILPLIERIDQGLKKMSDSGRLDELHRKYGF